MRKHLDRYRQAGARLWEKFGATPVEAWVTLPSGGAVRVQAIGNGEPLLFIQGASVVGTSWCGLGAALDWFRRILLDRPGCGLSDPIAGGRLVTPDDVDSYADRLVPEVLAALELDRATLMSTSYGGLFAVRAAAAALARVDRIVEYSWLMGAPTAGAPLSMRLGVVPGMKSVMIRMPMTPGVVKSLLRQLGMKCAVETATFRAW